MPNGLKFQRKHRFLGYKLKYLYYCIARRDVLQKKKSFGEYNENKIIYLINLEKEEWMKLKIPNKEWENMEFYLMSKENKMLITLNKKAYIIDLSKLKKV